MFDLRQPTVAAAMRRARSKKLLHSWVVNGDHVTQARWLWGYFIDMRFRLQVEKALIIHGNFYVVMEDFIPHQLNFDPISLQIIGGFETMMFPGVQNGDVSYERQQPTQRWANDDWLKRNRLWVPSDHERDARRHVAAKLDKLLHGK